MSHRIQLEPVFVLHTRPYSNTSLLVELLSKTHGRVVVIARSARGLKSRYQGKLQLFTPILASWSGQRELKTLGNIELNGPAFQLSGSSLLCGFYLNELLVRLLHREDPHPNVFDAYEKALSELQGEAISATLRTFEKTLLFRLGYGVPLKRDIQSGDPIQADVHYQFIPERGFLACEERPDDRQVFLGKSLLALEAEQFECETVARDSKRLMRMILSRHLGARPLKSRELMV